MSPEYVLDRMQMYEIKPLIESSYLRNKDNWEQARMIAYIMAQSNSTNKIEPTDIIKFSWDKTEEPTVVSDVDVERLTRKAEEYSKYFK